MALRYPDRKMPRMPHIPPVGLGNMPDVESREAGKGREPEGGRDHNAFRTGYAKIKWPGQKKKER